MSFNPKSHNMLGDQSGSGSVGAIRGAALVLLAAAVGGGAIHINEHDQNEQKKMIEGAAQPVLDANKEVIDDIYAIDDAKELAKEGMFKRVALHMETPKPYPVEKLRDGKEGRVLPSSFDIPKSTSASLRKQIFRDGKHITWTEAKEAAKLRDTTPASERYRTVAVDASNSSTDPNKSIKYAANDKEFQRYIRLTDSITQAAAESVKPLTAELKNDFDQERQNLDGYKRIAKLIGLQFNPNFRELRESTSEIDAAINSMKYTAELNHVELPTDKSKQEQSTKRPLTPETTQS
ncbi:MAG: hypothetical protein AAB436_03985 [Patescibacteria group bacterium]